MLTAQLVEKYGRFVLFLAVLTLFIISLTAAGAPQGTNAPVDWKKAEKNYIAALKSGNTGVQASAAYHIGKYNLAGAVAELKLLLERNNADNVKMSAALTLLKVGGNEGRTAVEAALKTEENELIAEFYRTILNSTITAQN